MMIQPRRVSGFVSWVVSWRWMDAKPARRISLGADPRAMPSISPSANAFGYRQKFRLKLRRVINLNKTPLPQFAPIVGGCNPPVCRIVLRPNLVVYETFRLQHHRVIGRNTDEEIRLVRMINALILVRDRKPEVIVPHVADDLPLASQLLQVKCGARLPR